MTVILAVIWIGGANAITISQKPGTGLARNPLLDGSRAHGASSNCEPNFELGPLAAVIVRRWEVSDMVGVIEERETKSDDL